MTGPFDERDALDRRLGAELRAAAPSTPEADAALSELRPRLHRERRRHRALVSGVSALGLAAAVVLGIVLFGGSDGPHVQTPPATRPDTTSTTVAPTTTTAVPVVPPSVEGTTPTSGPDDGPDDGGGESGDDSSNRGPGGGSDDSSGSGSGDSSGSGSGDDD